MRHSGERRDGHGPSGSGPVPQVLLVDPDRSYRRWLRALLTSVDIDVVAEADDGAEAASLTRSLAPDVVVVVLDLEGAAGIEAAQSVRCHDPAVPIIALATFEAAAWQARSGTGLYLYAMMPKEGLIESAFILMIRRAWAQRLREDAVRRPPA